MSEFKKIKKIIEDKCVLIFNNDQKIVKEDYPLQNKIDELALLICQRLNNPKPVLEKKQKQVDQLPFWK